MPSNDEPERGLPSLKASKEVRRRAIVLGRVRLRDAAPQFWLWTFVLFAAFGVIYWQVSERQLQSQKSAVMARQRTIAQTLSPRLVPLRDRVEQWVLELASASPEVQVGPELSLDKVSRSDGIYLRLLINDAESKEALRESAERSLHDGFTSCFFVGKPAPGGEQKRCYNPSNCPDGQLCNEQNVCMPPTQPFNLRLMYRALRVLSSDWTDDLHQATGDYQVRLFERDLDKVSHTDVPIAIEMFTSAKYFTAVIDEIPKAGIPPLPEPDAEASPDDAKLPNPEEFEAVRVQGVDHWVRVGIWELSTNQLLYRARERAGAKFIDLGRGKDPLRASTQRARQRQVNNCSIAQAIRERFEGERTPASSTD